MPGEIAASTGITQLLLIEDDPAIARALVEALQRENYRVEWCNSSAGGEAYARQQKPHLIILDLWLPDGSGYDL